MPTQLDVRVRWMIRNDYAAVQRIENVSFPQPWTPEELADLMRQDDTYGLVADVGLGPVGFVLYRTMGRVTAIENLAVDPLYRRSGIGSALVRKITSRLCSLKREVAVARVVETNLPAHLFFKACGFRATSVQKGLYLPMCDADAYVFKYRTKVACSA